MFKEKQAKSKQFTFDITELAKAKKYVKPTDLVIGKKYPFRGFYKSKDNGYGEAYVIFSDNFLLNASLNSFKYWESVVNETEGAVDNINAGKCVFTIEEYQLEKYHNKAYRIVLDDAE